jgi:hypothetical protein
MLKNMWAKRESVYRRLAAKTAPITAQFLLRQLRYLAAPDQLYPLFKKHDYWLLKDHFYRPFTNTNNMPETYWSKEVELPGISLDVDTCLKEAEGPLKQYFEEFRQIFPIEKPANPEEQFWLINGTYMAVDAHIYYAYVRHFLPRKILEIGSGRSTQVAAKAAEMNQQKNKFKTELVCIEPYPYGIVSSGLDKVAKVIESKVEDVDLATFKELDKGDILFIDSTHALREGGDVQYIYGQILPILKPGVIVHVHDISLPKPYPKVYFDYGWFWNEQYLLQAFLTHNMHAEVIWPGNYLMCKAPDRMNAVFPEIAIMRSYFPSSEPSAFWFKTK